MFLKETNTVEIYLEDYLYLEEGFNLSNFLEDYIKKLENVKIDKAYISKQKVKYNKLLSDFKSKLSKEEKVILDEKTKEIENNFKSISKDDILTESEDYMFMKESFIKDKIEKLKGVITKSFLTFDDNKLKGATIYLVVYLMNTIFHLGLTALFGSTIGMVLTFVLVTPINEEIGRYFALKNNSIDSYNSSLNIWEFINYVIPNILSGNIINSLIVIVGRVFVASELHSKNTDRMKNVLEDEQTKATIISVIYHILWNSLGVLFGIFSIPINAVLGNTVFKL
jgi:hypothetical protein